ncbi:oxygen-independent coproporphyrinogen III oxidase [Ostreibacterium oceani]|uniref:Coproporphyrinogen-III oxidase n=1 Tax=Ostreibacterium oceani TaxID=2654998 RepID=A0A6N7EVL7_9GAMM|nr:oxygen-independent coproporphyrinogen III oxidase [Ostreibacterium oceani]MPV85469.1 oxygen-independent coproporphyrinogen III oxidase [Ostreibacterium oceani]
MKSPHESTAVFDQSLIEKYSVQGPRYTSYPTAVEFTEAFDHQRFTALAIESNASQRDLSLYVHVPFCDTICYFCACNKIITKNKTHSAPYLDYVEKEMQHVASLIDADRKVVQLHWGGGTPTFLTTEEQWRLTNMFRQYFNFATDDEGEFSIEIDPRTVTEQSIADLREMGFNRLSFGIQDFDPKVQIAVNRIQSYESTKLIIEAGYTNGFHSISVDLIYGLPFQNVKNFEKTVDKIIGLSPDRIAVFNYAHLPHLFKGQKQILDKNLPSPAEKLAILEMTITKLIDAGYVFIGLDHFAKPDDAMALDQKVGRLYRNFQGYSTFSECDLFGFGMSSISMVGNSYSQNDKNKDSYYERLDAGQLPTVRGVELSTDDVIRRKVITEIMCNMRLDFDAIGAQFGIDANQYFAQEKQALIALAADGLLTLTEHGFVVLPPGRLLVRNICMVFDAYLPKTQENTQEKTFSKAI